MDLLLKMLQGPEEGKTLLETFRQELFRNSVTKARLGRLVVCIFTGPGDPEAKRDSIIQLYLDYGCTLEEAQEKYYNVVRCFV